MHAGTLPPAWSSTQIEYIYLNNNNLTGKACCNGMFVVYDAIGVGVWPYSIKQPTAVRHVSVVGTVGQRPHYLSLSEIGVLFRNEVGQSGCMRTEGPVSPHVICILFFSHNI
jgi:hypothetical protein